jgi:hypothetical protein
MITVVLKGVSLILLIFYSFSPDVFYLLISNLFTNLAWLLQELFLDSYILFNVRELCNYTQSFFNKIFISVKNQQHRVVED